MCFIKKIFQSERSYPHEPSIQSSSFQEESTAKKSPLYQPFCGINYNPSILPFLCPKNFLLPQLLNQLMGNAALLMKLEEKCNESTLMLEEACEESQSPNQQDLQVQSTETWRTKDKSVEKLFGNKEYRYKLRLKQKFPITIYKERNINLAIELIDAKKNISMNANLVHLGVAACKTDGQWVPETENGDSFIQGKTEADLYHGEASFAKIYPRDVSRSFPNGRVHLIVYPKPSLLRFHSSASNLEQHIEAEDIEPLIIKDITIKAKKRQYD